MAIDFKYQQGVSYLVVVCPGCEQRQSPSDISNGCCIWHWFILAVANNFGLSNDCCVWQQSVSAAAIDFDFGHGSKPLLKKTSSTGPLEAPDFSRGFKPQVDVMATMLYKLALSSYLMRLISVVDNKMEICTKKSTRMRF